MNKKYYIVNDEIIKLLNLVHLLISIIRDIILLGDIMSIFDLFTETKPKDEDDELKEEYIKNSEQEEYNFEEEDLEEDDYYYEDDK